jgi:hypothetical protein
MTKTIISQVKGSLARLKEKDYVFFGSGQGLNPGPYIFYALSQPTELSSRGQKKKTYV